ncbi:helix-turn-helix domain-containing protein [Saccharopolyspora sp. NPDC047091]|uniref:helix-turn-helix domain-containing protein n=1 Tax=Saccharopolyspora sp. NPDC047091 TaxID=3155924 RepID=UPI00340E98B6
MNSLALDPIQPDGADAAVADEALQRIKGYLGRHRDQRSVPLVVEDDGCETLIVPRGAVELLARVLAHMAAGTGVSVVPSHAELTTQQAAEMLNVSRPFLVGLLEAGEIDYRKVGTHRRVRAESVLAYLREDDKRRREAADELTRLTQEMGLD